MAATCASDFGAVHFGNASIVFVCFGSIGKAINSNFASNCRFEGNNQFTNLRKCGKRLSRTESIRRSTANTIAHTHHTRLDNDADADGDWVSALRKGFDDKCGGPSWEASRDDTNVA